MYCVWSKSKYLRHLHNRLAMKVSGQSVEWRKTVQKTMEKEAVAVEK